jgi:hypothetical protein
VIAPVDCAAFAANPNAARDLTTLNLDELTVELRQPSGAVQAACFGAEGFVPTGVDGAIAETTLQLTDNEAASAVTSPTVSGIGTIGVAGEPPREGAAASGLRRTASVDATSGAAVVSPTVPPPPTETGPSPPPAPPVELLPVDAQQPVPPATTAPPPAAPPVDLPVAPTPPPAVPDPPPPGGGGGSGGGGGGGGCFVAGTLVLTEGGMVPIEALAVGDVVRAANEHTGVVGLHPVSATFVHDDKAVFAVHVVGDASAEVIEATDIHPWFVVGLGWRSTAALHGGDVVVAVNGARFVVEAVIDTGTRARVFNIEVDDAHTYFVGASSIWVHNKQDADNNIQLN